MSIGKISGSMEVLATSLYPHKEAEDLIEQQVEEVADDIAKDTYETTIKPDDYVYVSENYNDILKVNAGEGSSSPQNDTRRHD